MNKINFGNPIFSKENLKEEQSLPVGIVFFKTKNNEYAIYFGGDGYAINIEHYKKAQKALNDFFNDYNIKQIEKNNQKIINEYEQREKNIIIQELTKMLKPSCIKCNKNEGYIYVIKSKKYYKIGITQNYKKRKKKYITKNPNKIQVIICQKVNNYVKTEKKLHNLFKDKNHHGEWFILDKNDIDIIKKHLTK